MGKNMKDKSLFMGIKELGEFRFVSHGGFWNIMLIGDNSYKSIGNLKKITRQSNKSMYDYAKGLIKNDYDKQR
jgi:hypothetical protein